MKFRRKSTDPVDTPAEEAGDAVEVEAQGPFDVDDVTLEDAPGHVDLGSLLIVPMDGVDVQLQVDEATDSVQAVLLATADGAVELRAFAAPRGGDLWSEFRPRIAAEYAQRGGTATEREGTWGTELIGQVTVKTEDGRTGTQATRVIGINGSRWMLRATMLGLPAVDFENADIWEAAIGNVIVRRGGEAMPVGAELPLVLPPRDRLIQQDS